jgi:hypothetical protein
LLGQMLLLIGAALLVAQAVNFAFILGEQQKLSLARNEGPAIGRFTQVAAVVAATAPEGRPLLLGAHRVGPGADYRLVPQSLVDRERLRRDARVEERLVTIRPATRIGTGSSCSPPSSTTASGSTPGFTPRDRIPG